MRLREWIRRQSRWEVGLVLSLLLSLLLVTPRVGESDAVEAFSYLPSLVLDGDLDFRNEYQAFYAEDPEGRRGFKETFLDRRTPTGLQINFAPVGSALLWSPFYLLAHGVSHLGQGMGFALEPDGLSFPYRLAVSLGSALYGVLGLWLSFRLARRFASEEAAFFVVLTLWWATPVAYYLYIAPTMSHATSLFAVALFFSLWPRAKAPGASVSTWALWGAAAGLMALVREQDGLYAMVAWVVALSPARELGLRQRVERLAAFGSAALLVFTPQIVVYLALYGRLGPAPEVQNKMAWLSPHFFQVLLSPEHGLFFWSPVLLVFSIGAYRLWRREPEVGLVLATGFFIQIYISGAVESWTQAGAFGARRFVGATVIFALWGGAFLDWARERLDLGRKTLALAMSFFVVWNVSLMMQFGIGLMDRQKLVWREVLHNHVYEVPPRILSVAARYFVARDELPESAREDRPE